MRDYCVEARMRNGRFVDVFEAKPYPAPPFLPREVVSIHIGKAGTGIGSSCWEQLSLEHGIQPDGHSDTPLGLGVNSFFQETAQGRYKARAIFVDLDPDSMENIIDSFQADLFYTDNLVRGNELSGEIFFRGEGQADVVDRCMDIVRRFLEGDDYPGGFIIQSSIAGGTGSAVGSMIMEELRDELFRGTTVLGYGLFPDFPPDDYPSAKSIYNSVLATDQLLCYTDMSVVLHNAALKRICPMPKTDFEMLNEVVAMAFSSHTKFLRFGGSIHQSLRSMAETLVTHPWHKLLVSSYDHSLTKGPATVRELFPNLFDRCNNLASCFPYGRTYPSALLHFQGYPNVEEIYQPLKDEFQSQYQWQGGAPQQFSMMKSRAGCPISLVCSRHPDPPALIPAAESVYGSRQTSIGLLANCSCVGNVLADLNGQFDAFFENGACYTDEYYDREIDRQEFLDAREGLGILVDEYARLDTATVMAGFPDQSRVRFLFGEPAP